MRPRGSDVQRLRYRMGATTVALMLASVLVAGSPATSVSAGPVATAVAPILTISAGTEHNCALLMDGTVKCWGYGLQGELGQGDAENRGDNPNEMGGALLPVPLGTGRTATSVATGQFHGCAILDDATVKCWGDNGWGQLGVGDRDDRGERPGQLGDLLPAVDLGTGRTATAISAGNDHSCAILDDHTVKCWGEGGLLGTGDDIDYGDDPNDMGDLLPIVNLGARRTAIALSSGAGHNCAVLDNHKIKCWGVNFAGALGLGDREDRGDGPGEMGGQLPAVALGTGRTALAVTTGYGHTCALLDDHTVKCWGNNTYGQLGLGDTISRSDDPGEMGDDLPRVQLGTGRTALAVSAGRDHTCALLDDHTVKCWGRADFGQLGQGDTVVSGDGPGEMGDQLPRVDLGMGRTATAVAAGDRHVCAVLDDGGIKCWGKNGSLTPGAAGALGLGDDRHRGDNPDEMGDHLPEVVLTGPAIVGRVSDQITGEGVADQEIAVLASSGQSMAVGTTTNAFGNYAVQVPAGTWYLYLLAGPNSGWYGAPTPVAVTTDAEQADPVLTRRDGDVVGTVREVGTSNPVTTPCACLWTMALDAHGAQERIVDTVGPTFAMALPAGQHQLVAVDATGAHAPRFHPSAADVGSSTAVPVTAGATTTADLTLPAQAAPTRSAVISGVVTDQTTGAPVTSGHVVVLRAGDYSFVKGSRTSEVQGAWSVEVPAGDYVVGFLDPGRHEFEWYQDQPGGSLGSATIVSAPADHVNGALTPTTGTIKGFAGYGPTRFAGIWVLAIGPNGLARQAVARGSAGYEIDGLAPGNYRLAFVNPTNGRVEYWPDRAAFADADVVTVTAGHTTTADADLASPP